MNENQMELLKKELDNGACCAVYHDGKIFVSKERGIRPLLFWLEDNPELLRDSLAADKVIGKAAALLFVYGGIRQVFTRVISEPAEQVFLQYGVQVQSDVRVKAIRNRAGDGLCPMEQRALPLDSPEEAYRVFRELVLHL